MPDYSQTQADSRPAVFEYLRVQVDDDAIKRTDELLAQLGREGWEMTGAVTTQTYLHLWFKRRGSGAPPGQPLCIAL